MSLEFQNSFDVLEQYKNSKTTYGDPIHLNLVKQQAKLLFQMKDYNSSIQFWKTVRGQPFGISKQEKSKIYEEIGKCYNQLGFTEKADEYIDESKFIYKQDYERFIFIGDVHGCFDELMKLLNKCNYDEKKDKIVFVGDIIGKGPKSKDVLSFSISNEVECVRGNHEHFILQWWISEYQKEPNELILPSSHQKLCQELSENDWKWLLNLPFHLQVKKFFVVHAGINPYISIENQSIYDMMNMRSITKNKKISYKVEEEPWAKYSNQEMIIFGHDAIRKLQIYENAIGLDSGCVYGGNLTGLIYSTKNDETRLIEVRSEEIYQKVNN
eukprot:gene5718-9538_t